MLIGYARVSTEDQSLDLQLDALKKVDCQQFFTEKLSSAELIRPQLKAAINFARSGDIFVVWKLDRLARSLKQLINTVEEFEGRGIGFRSLTENIDTTTPSGRLIFHVFGALAEFERGIIRDRTIAGLKSARERGRFGGRPSVMTVERQIAARTLLEKKELTIKQIAGQLGVSEASLYKHIPRPRSLS
jgi:DNA invertase Pin-like site-specific DNA recombinase